MTTLPTYSSSWAPWVKKRIYTRTSPALWHRDIPLASILNSLTHHTTIWLVIPPQPWSPKCVTRWHQKHIPKLLPCNFHRRFKPSRGGVSVWFDRHKSITVRCFTCQQRSTDKVTATGEVTYIVLSFFFLSGNPPDGRVTRDRTSREYYELSWVLYFFVMSWVEYFSHVVLNSTHDKKRCTHQT
jgi:hypothetical protein